MNTKYLSPRAVSREKKEVFFEYIEGIPLPVPVGCTNEREARDLAKCLKRYFKTHNVEKDAGAAFKAVLTCANIRITKKSSKDTKYLSPRAVSRDKKTVIVTCKDGLRLTDEYTNERDARDSAKRLKRYLKTHNVEIDGRSTFEAMRTCAAIRII